MKRPKILFFVTEDWYFWSHRLPIAKAALNNGMDVTVVTKVNAHGERIEREGFQLIPLNVNRSGKNPFRELFIFLLLIGIYKREKPTLVHHVALKPVLYGSWAARLAGVPFVVNALAGLGHVFTATGARTFFLKKLLKLAFSSALSPENVRTIFQNPDDLNAFVEEGFLLRGQARLIKGSGVNTKILSPTSNQVSEPVVVLVARMLWTKGVGELVEASKILKEKGVAVRMLLVGTPDPMNPASINENTLCDWAASGIVEWLGFRQDIPDILRQSSIAVLPSSYGEGIPKSLIEAASTGLPIVTYDVPGCREIVRHGDNGFLVPPKDVRALANAIEDLVKNPQLRSRMGKRGREIVIKEFSEEVIVEKTLALYKELLGDKWAYTNEAKA